MTTSARMTILRKLVEEYPEFVSKQDLQQCTCFSDEDLERHIHYLEEEGFIKVKWTVGGFLAKATAAGIMHIGEQIVDRETVKTILKPLGDSYPDYVGSETFQELLGLNEDQLRRPFKYLEETGLVEIKWFIGKKFLVKITSHGIDQLENL